MFRSLISRFKTAKSKVGDAFVDLINDFVDDVAPIANGNLNAAASTLAKEGARQRRQTLAEKQARVHAELRAAVGQ
jgi:hypothetical protein